MSEHALVAAPLAAKHQSIKCVVWDLDNTIWDGVLLEDRQVTLRPHVVAVIKELDRRGILHSIASKNEYHSAMAKLEAFGIKDYFLYPQISWNSKAAAVQAVASAINIGIDTLAFVDDQPFEREEVAYSLPAVLCIDADEIDAIPDMDAMQPRFITDDSKLRRSMYQSDAERNQAEKEFVGPSEEFLATLGMTFTIAPAQEDDLQRAEELTMRTHQLNTTGYTYSYDELNAFRTSGTHKLYIASLDDKYGTYGKIGLMMIACQPDVWVVKLLLMSCRVMSRGVGTIMMNHALNSAKAAGARLRAEFVANDRNRMMYITYKFAGFREIDRVGNLSILENDLAHVQPFPAYVRVQLPA